MIIRGETTKENLQHIYSTIRRIIKNPECYYTQEEIENLIKDKKNVFYMGEKTNEKIIL